VLPIEEERTADVDKQLGRWDDEVSLVLSD
jgi:hypothetical protein